MPKRTPAEDRRSRPTESAISDETIRSTGLSAASVLAAHLRAEQRSEAYLAEAQRLSHTGSFGWKPSTGEIIWSDETFRIFQYDRATAPTVERVLQRVHPEDRARVQETIDRAAQTGKDVDFEHRLLMPDGSVRHVHVVARALSDESGGLEFAGAVMDVTEHQEARAALEGALGEVKKSERQLQLVVDTIPTMVWGARPDGEIDLCNRPLLEYVGETLEDLRRGYSHLLHPEDVTEVMDNWNAALTTRKPFESEHRVRGADGVYRWMLVRAAPLPDEQGNIVRWYGASTDIEDRKRAEEKVSRQQRELRQILDLVPHHIAVAVPDGTLVYGNHVFLDYYGLTTEDLQDSETAELARRFTHPDDIEPFLAAWQRGSAGTAPWETEVRFRRRDGEYRWLLVRGTPLRDDGGRTVRWYITGTDIDDRKKAEERIRQDERELRHLVDSVPQHIIILDADGRRLYGNRATLDYFGCTVEEFRAPDFLRTVCHPDHFEKLQSDRQQFSRGEPFELETRVRSKDGTYRWFLFHYRPFREEDGRIARWYVTTTDIEDRKRTEELQRENLALREEVERVSMFDEIVGTSPPLRAVLASVSRVAPTDSTVLITGETGTGKELVARAIHKRSSRSSRPFVSVNCAAIPPTLITSELFGHEKGAFTGALTRRLGRFELADGGTIFLDEIGDLQPDTQLTLLRVLQEREFERLGSTRPIKVDVRVIAATNRDLKAAMASGAFRADLFYRLSVFPIEMPPLRERTTDIPLLVAYFADRYASNAGKTIRHVDKRTLDLVRSYRWPGNVRELQNVIERAVIVCETDTLVVDENWLSMETLATQPPVLPLGDALVTREREMIEAALAETRGKVAGRSGAAARLGLPPSTLESKIRALKISKDQYKRP